MKVLRSKLFSRVNIIVITIGATILIAFLLYWFGVYIPIKKETDKEILEAQKLTQQEEDKKKEINEKIARFKDNVFEPTKLKSGEKFGDFTANDVIAFCSHVDCKQMIEGWKKDSPNTTIDFPVTGKTVSELNYWASFYGEAKIKAKYTLKDSYVLLSIEDLNSLLKIPIPSDSVDDKGDAKVELSFAGQDYNNFKKAIETKGLIDSGETMFTINGIGYYGYPYKLTPGNRATFVKLENE